MTPVALSKVGIPGINVLVLNEYPLHVLGLYDNLESWEQRSGYVWSSWTTKAAPPAHVNSALQAMMISRHNKVLALLVNHLTSVLHLHRARDRVQGGGNKPWIRKSS